jgi:hypothetical protein
MENYNPKLEPPEGVYGMCAVIYPDQLHWSVYYLLNATKPLGVETLARTRELHRSMTSGQTTSERMRTSTVIGEVPGVAPEDQPVIGLLTSLLATTAAESNRMASVYGHALAELTGQNFFIVRASDAKEGVSTKFEPISVFELALPLLTQGKNVYQAFADRVNSDPSVLTIIDRIMTAIKRAPRSVQERLARVTKEMQMEGRSDPQELLRILKEVDPGIMKNVRH